MLKRWFGNRLARSAESDMRQYMGFLAGLNDVEMGALRGFVWVAEGAGRPRKRA